MSTLPSGVAFPFRIAGGGVARSAGPEKIKENLRILLSTRIGERVMLRDYGGGVQSARDEPNDSALHAVVRHELQRSLARFLPEIQLIGPIRIAASGGQLEIAFEYRIAMRDGDESIELRI